MKTLKVAIIDDGISSESIPEGQTFESIVFQKDASRQVNEEGITSHGTLCYHLFCDYVSVPYHLVSIKVLNSETCTGSLDSMIQALRWCKEQEIDVINLSIGTRQYLDFSKLAQAISDLTKTIVVAACSNENTITFPACLPSVIGVRHCDNESLKGKFAYIDNPYDQIEIMSYVDNHSNSMVAPVVTAQICNYLEKGYLTVDEVRRKLKNNSVRETSFANYDFYRELLWEWERIDVPIVVFPTNHKSSILKALILEFVKEGYRAVALSTNLATNLEEFVLSLRWESEDITYTRLMELLYNFTLPDILFLHVDLQESPGVIDVTEVDIVIEPSWFGIDAKNLFVNIKELLE